MRARSVLAAIGILLILGSGFFLHERIPYPGFYALAPTLGTVLVLVSGSTGSYSWPERLLSSRQFVWIGDRSYSIYLWHWPVLLFAGAYGLLDEHRSIVLILAVILLLSAVSYRFIELPFWKGIYSRSRPGHAILMSALSVGLLVAAFTAFHGYDNGVSTASADGGDYFPRWDMPEIYRAGSDCDTWYHSAELVPCSLGTGGAQHTALLIGDSIGVQWFSMLSETYQAPGWQVVVLMKSACPIVNRPYFYERINAVYQVCSEWRESALSYIRNLAPDVVFIGSSADYGFSGEEWEGGVRDVLAEITDAAGQIVLIPGTPRLSFRGPSCLESPYRFSLRLKDSRRECEERMASKRSAEVANLLDRAASQFDNAHVLDLSQVVCPDDRCAAETPDGVTVFRDRQHLTNRFVMARLPQIFERLDRLGVAPDHFAGTRRVSIEP